MGGDPHDSDLIPTWAFLVVGIFIFGFVLLLAFLSFR